MTASPRACAIVLALAVAAPAGARAAGEQHYEDHPAPASVEEFENPLGQGFAERRRRPLYRVLERLGRRLPIFGEEGRLELALRSYWLYGKLQGNDRREAWAYGAQLGYESGWLRDRVSVGLSAQLAQPIHAPSDRDGTRLLRPRQRPYALVGESFARIKLGEAHELAIYRRGYDTPYLNRQDSRMTPNSFEGYLASGRFGDREASSLAYVGGYVARMKARDSDRFVSMGQTATGDDGPKRGLWMLGALYEDAAGLSLGAIHYSTRDVLRISYAVAEKTWTRGDALALRATLQYTDQRSSGERALTGASFDTSLVAAELAASYRNAMLRLAASTTSNEARIRSPYGSRPSPVSLMLRDFDRAGEDAWVVGVSYVFTPLGLPWLSAFASYARGGNARDEETGLPLRDHDEFDLTVDLRPDRGRLEGFWLRIRAAFVDERGGGGRSQNELRLILSHDIPVR